MFDLEDRVGFVMWTAETGNASRAEWELMGEGKQDKWLRMARVAIREVRRFETLGAPRGGGILRKLRIVR